jgi:hypothetical protein
MKTSVQIILLLCLVESALIAFLACFLHRTRQRYRYALAIRSAASSRRCPDGSRVDTAAMIGGLPEPIFNRAELEQLFSLVNQPTPMGEALVSIRSKSRLVPVLQDSRMADGEVSATAETAAP